VLPWWCTAWSCGLAEGGLCVRGGGVGVTLLANVASAWFARLVHMLALAGGGLLYIAGYDTRGYASDLCMEHEE
jgi:hypothetical protein